MVDWRSTFRKDRYFGVAFSQLVDEWLPGLYDTEHGRLIIDSLHRLSTVPKSEAGEALIKKALSPNRGPLIIPERPGIDYMKETVRAYVDPKKPGTIKFNLALLKAFGHLKDDEDAVNFIKGTILHELVHWCRFNNVDTNKRRQRKRADWGRKLERIFYGLPEMGAAVELKGKLLKAYYHFFDHMSGAVLKSVAPLVTSTTKARANAGEKEPIMPDNRYTSLAEIPIHYDRFNSDRSDYGTIGKPINPFINIEFAGLCEPLFEDIKDRMRPHFGELKAIVTGGVSRRGSGSSLHHQNRAFDLDGFAFENGKFWRADSFPSDPHLYLAIESDIRRHFSTVLTYDYNTAHQDHIHFDNGRQLRFRKTTRTHALYIQNALNLIYMIPVGTDGVWGPETKEAVRELREQLDIGSFKKLDNWLTFCDVTANHAINMAI